MAQKIKTILISWLGEDDYILWSFSASGVYSVKFGYHLPKNKFHFAGTSSNLHPRGLWKWVWSGEAMPKCKNLIWMVCFDILLVS